MSSIASPQVVSNIMSFVLLLWNDNQIIMLIRVPEHLGSLYSGMFCTFAMKCARWQSGTGSGLVIWNISRAGFNQEPVPCNHESDRLRTDRSFKNQGLGFGGRAHLSCILTLT